MYIKYEFFFASSDAIFEGRPISAMPKYVVAPLSLCVLRCFFHLGDFRFHRFYQLRQLHLHLFPRLGVHIMLHALAAHVRRRVAALVEMIDDPVNAPAAGF